MFSWTSSVVPLQNGVIFIKRYPSSDQSAPAGRELTTIARAQTVASSASRPRSGGDHAGSHVSRQRLGDARLPLSATSPGRGSCLCYRANREHTALDPGPAAWRSAGGTCAKPQVGDRTASQGSVSNRPFPDIRPGIWKSRRLLRATFQNGLSRLRQSQAGSERTQWVDP